MPSVIKPSWKDEHKDSSSSTGAVLIEPDDSMEEDYTETEKAPKTILFDTIDSTNRPRTAGNSKHSGAPVPPPDGMQQQRPRSLSSDQADRGGSNSVQSNTNVDVNNYKPYPPPSGAAGPRYSQQQRNNGNHRCVASSDERKQGIGTTTPPPVPLPPQPPQFQYPYPFPPYPAPPPSAYGGAANGPYGYPVPPPTSASPGQYSPVQKQQFMKMYHNAAVYSQSQPPHHHYFDPATAQQQQQQQQQSYLDPQAAGFVPSSLPYNTRTRAWSGDNNNNNDRGGGGQHRRTASSSSVDGSMYARGSSGSGNAARPNLRTMSSERTMQGGGTAASAAVPHPGQQRHRRSVSFNENMSQRRHSGSGSSDMADFFGRPPATMAAMPTTAAAAAATGFSPRQEFIKLSGWQSPSNRSPASSPVTGSQTRKTWQGNTTPPTLNGAGVLGYGSMSPNNMMGMTSLPQSLASSDRSDDGGGEALFRTTRRPESTRKRHIRQQSAQLFMEDCKGVEQPPACRDVFWLLLFVFHLIGLVYLKSEFSYAALETVDDDEVSAQMDNPDSAQVIIHYRNLVYIVAASTAFGLVASSVLLAVMMAFARRFVQVALVSAFGLSFIWGTAGIGLSPKTIVPITGFIAMALTVGYAFIVWERVPFAAANLLTALTAIRAFPGTLVVAFLFQLLTMGFMIYFCIVFFGVYDSMQNGRIVIEQHWAAVMVYIGFGVSFFWTYQVLMNAVQVATAGVVGAWWYQHEGDAGVKQSSVKTIFYSMGSVCFASLFVGPMQVVHQVSVLFRPSSEESSLLCLHVLLHCIQSCISNTIDTLWKRINPWGLTFVGLYGYGFVDASTRATELFHRRGWTSIVNDDLVPNILLMTSVVIGGITGFFTHVLSGLEGLHVLSIDQPGPVSFCMGTVIGWVITRVLFAVIGSAVNAVIVCFASSPVDFEDNHTELSQEMRAAWREVWPGALDVVDMRLAMAGSGGNMPPPPYPMSGHHQRQHSKEQMPLL